MSELAAKHDLIICVDCGTLSTRRSRGSRRRYHHFDHLGGETLPNWLGRCEPKPTGRNGGFGPSVRSAVVFLTLVEARRPASRGWGRPRSDVPSGLVDATSRGCRPADRSEPRFVRQGLRVMARRERPGIVALSDLARRYGPNRLSPRVRLARASTQAGASGRPIWAHA